MLQHLQVKNYAIIDSLEIDFHSGLNIITGETGAGKSILLGALGLILGNRADVSTLKDKENSCVVEGTFNMEGYGLETLFQENDLEFVPNTVIRRHISPSGKSRAFVNDLPVTLSLLKEIVEQVIDIHSQHQSLLLANKGFQLSVVDSFANTDLQVEEYKKSYAQYCVVLGQLHELTEQAQQVKADLDYLQFQWKQLDEAHLVEDEEVELEQQQQQLAHAEDIKLALGEVQNLSDADDISVLAWLKQMEDAFWRIEPFFPQSKEFAERIESARIDLRDLTTEIQVLAERVEHNPEEFERVNQRLDTINSLMQKHRVDSVKQLVEIRDELRVKIDAIENYDYHLEQKAKELKGIEDKAMLQATAISKQRVGVCQKFEESIQNLLAQLGMPHAHFKVDIHQEKELLPNGIDKAVFLFSANKQMGLQELSKVASGGELSRLMLSLKSLMVKAKGLPTIILDEIDTGVSGEIADKVGNIIHDMSQEMQVINITHLPQIASKGTTHFKVYKDEKGQMPTTKIRLLSSEERLQEIAQMLSGEQISEAALVNAKHLLSGNL